MTGEKIVANGGRSSLHQLRSIVASVVFAVQVFVLYCTRTVLNCTRTVLYSTQYCSQIYRLRNCIVTYKYNKRAGNNFSKEGRISERVLRAQSHAADVRNGFAHSLSCAYDYFPLSDYFSGFFLSL